MNVNREENSLSLHEHPLRDNPTGLTVLDDDWCSLLTDMSQEDFLLRRNREQSRFRLSEFIHTISPDHYRFAIELNQVSEFLRRIHAPSRAHNLEKFVGNIRSRCSHDPFLAATWGRLSPPELENQLSELQWLLVESLVNGAEGIDKFFVICNDPDDASAIQDTLTLRVDTFATSPQVREQINRCYLSSVNIPLVRSCRPFFLSCSLTESIKNVVQPDPHFSRHILSRLYHLIEKIAKSDSFFHIAESDPRILQTALLLVLETRGSILYAHFSLSKAFFGITPPISLFEGVFDRLRSMSIPMT